MSDPQDKQDDMIDEKDLARGPSSELERITRDARDSQGPREVNWAALEAKLFDRVDAEARAEAAREKHRGRRGLWLPVAAALAVAAGSLLVLDRGEAPSSYTPVAVAPNAAAKVLTAHGTVFVHDEPAVRDSVIALGERVEARPDSRALFNREGKVTFLVEASTQAEVTHVDGALILALASGSIEAQVTPVAQGEAFAIDVGPTRVAVHGTHLRVARDGEKVTVDLTEGVVSIGTPPRVGSTYGELVTAPAHVEFIASDAKGTIRVDHAPSSVRVADPLGRGETQTASQERQPAPQAMDTPRTQPTAMMTVPRPHDMPAVKVDAVAPSSSLAPNAPAPAPLNPEAQIASAVNACLAARPPAQDVRLTVSSTIELQLTADGAVQMARFNPPLAPEVQTCAAEAIYKTRFPRGGNVSIPITYQK